MLFFILTRSPTINSLFHSSTESFQALLFAEDGPKLTAQRKSDGYSLLHIAAHNNSVECLKLMMDDKDTAKAMLALKVVTSNLVMIVKL